MKTVMINGVEYVEKPPKHIQAANILLPYLALSIMMGGTKYNKKHIEVDLASEFELIQKKQSKLSKSEREYIVKQFNNKFKLKDS